VPNESDILLMGYPEPQKKVLEAKWKEWHDGIGNVNFLSEARKEFSKFLKANPSVDTTEGKMLGRLQARMQEDKVSPYSDKVNQIVDELVKPVPDTGGFFSRDKFGIEQQQNPVNTDLQDAALKEIERRKNQ